MLASPEDLASFVQSDVDTATATLLLSVATSVIQSATGQQLVYVANDTVSLAVVNNEIKLPQFPVVDVTAVQGLASGEWLVVQDVIRPTYLLDGSTSSVWWTGNDETPWWTFTAQLPWPLCTVTYSHGYQVIPDDLRGVSLSVAARMMANPAGVSSETVGYYQVRYDRAGGAGLTDLEMLVIEKYRRAPGTIQLLERPMHTNQF